MVEVDDMVRASCPPLAALIDTLNGLDGRVVNVNLVGGNTAADRQRRDEQSMATMRARMFLYTGSQR